MAPVALRVKADARTVVRAAEVLLRIGALRGARFRTVHRDETGMGNPEDRGKAAIAVFRTGVEREVVDTLRTNRTRVLYSTSGSIRTTRDSRRS